MKPGQSDPGQSDPGQSDPFEREKRAAAEASAAFVERGMVVGLGTGSTVAFLLPALAGRGLDITCVATSPATGQAAAALGLRVVNFDGIGRLDVAIDGADQVDAARWLVKGGGGAHTREKIVANAADRFIVIVSSNKLVDRVHAPIPLELLGYGLESVLTELPNISLRSAPHTPDGGVLADYHGPVEDPAELAERFAATPGIVGHGLFPPHMTSLTLVGRGDQVEEVGPPS